MKSIPAIRTVATFVVLVVSVALKSQIALASGTDAIEKQQRPSVAVERALTACAPELIAYLRVMRLARQFGNDGDVFEGALEDLHSQLSDCMNDSIGSPLDKVSRRTGL